MQLIRVENGAVVSHAGPGSKFRTETGEVICNFDKLPLSELKAFGFLPLVDQTPDFDARISRRESPVYTVNENDVAVVYAVVDHPIEQLRNDKINAAYARCRSILDAQSSGYSQAEIATFPLLQAEVTQYNIDQTVGPFMQAVVDRGRLDAAALSALLMPKITIQSQALQKRDDLVSQILAAGTPNAVVDIDIDSGWPA